MTKLKIVFLCHFSNPIVRSKLDLYKYSLRRLIYRIIGGGNMYDDFAIWVTDYIKEFEKHKEIEFHIVAPHYGLKRETQVFEMNGIIYHFFRWNYGIIQTLLNHFFHLEELNDYKNNRKKIKSIIQEISPNLLILCGAENPYYSLGVLDNTHIPTYVILQTLLNDPKRIEMGVGTPYRRKKELDVFRCAHYFSTAKDSTISKIREVNPNAVFLPVKFPTHRPVITIPKEKDYDFSFFARSVEKNKGIEDLIKALLYVKREKEDVRLQIIGVCPKDYKNTLNSMIAQMGLEKNIFFAGYFIHIQDAYENVVKAKAVVVPGITALNSTVRESLFMEMPTIAYDVPGLNIINKEQTCVFAVKMGDVEDLAKKMFYVLEHPDVAKQVAVNGKAYAEKEYSNVAIVNKLVDYCQQIIKNQV